MARNVLQALILFALLVTLLGMPLLLAPHRIRPPFFVRIQKGMTEHEVEELLGAKAGYYDGCGWNVEFTPSFLGASKTWCSRRGAVIIWFDENGQVTRHGACYSVPVTWWAKLCHRFVPPPELTAEDIIGWSW